MLLRQSLYYANGIEYFLNIERWGSCSLWFLVSAFIVGVVA
jgi:hypothetical protein